MSSELQIDRSYIDNFSVKEFTKNNLIAKYFPDIDVSLRNIGMVGFTTEQVSNISEDLFNTASVLFRETFPNRAQIPESIYSHAAIFQLSNAFSNASSCNFLLVLEEEAIISNMQNNYDKDTAMWRFFIDKNTVINIENIPYVLDYDIEMRIVQKGKEKDPNYIFSASYLIPENFQNSLTNDNINNDPYIKIRRSSDGYIALEVRCHQCVRSVITEDIISSGTINYPVIDVPFEGLLAGFDIRYKTSTEDSYKTQLKSLVIYSQPIEDPFCYYQLADENTLRITFNTKDGYFIPEYGSSLEITLYNTLGEEGNFDLYTGNDISVVSNDENYPYVKPYITAARPLTSSSGGKNQMSIDELQSLAVMMYRTATALTTEADLSEYFSNYKTLYSNSDIMFIKKRDDIYERIYSAFIIMKNGDYIYKTNTLNLDLNLSDMVNTEKNIYMIEPGTLFTASQSDYRSADFFRDDVLSKQNEEWYQEYLIAKSNNEVPYITDNIEASDLPDYLKNRQASFAEYKKRKGYQDKSLIFDYENNQNTLMKYDDPHNANGGKFLYINPFLIRFKKNPNLVSLYMTYIDQSSTVDFIDQTSDSYVQFITYQLRLKREFAKQKKYNMSLKLMPSIGISEDYPIINAKIVNIDGEDEIEYDLNNKYNVMNNDLRVFVIISDSVKDVCAIELYPTEYDVETENFTFSASFLTDDHITTDGRLRLLSGTIYKRTDEYQECLSTSINALKVVGDTYPASEFNDKTMIRWSIIKKYLPHLYTDDMEISGPPSDAEEDKYKYVQQVMSDDYYQVSDSDYTIYYHYNKDGSIEKDDNQDPIEYTIDEIFKRVRNGELKEWSDVISLVDSSEILIPMSDVVCTIYTAYRRKYDEDSKRLELIDPDDDFITDDIRLINKFHDKFNNDDSLNNYIITNIYNTGSDPLTFLKPLNNVRSNLIFKDYSLMKSTDNEGNPIEPYYINDMMDVNMSSLPFIRWSTELDDEKLSFFMNSFLAQYNNLVNIINTKLRNETAIDVKFYNTYGRSKNFIIGEEDEQLDTVNLSLSFDIWFIPGTDLISAVSDVKAFIKNEIETINSDGLNNLYISNLMRKIELNFAYVNHIRFNYINDYDPKYQAVKNYATDLTQLSVEERRNYVPEFLVIDTDDITINEFFSS